MTDYDKLSRRLATVRRAWKRTAALAGLAIVTVEAVGIMTVAFLLDWIYQPRPSLRLALLAVVAVAIVTLVARHVLAPLLRRISDDQLALYIEEHSDKFEGSLMTAAELGTRKASIHCETPKAMTDAIIAAATHRAEGMSVRAVLDFGRLRKYALVAVGMLAIYGGMALAFPDRIGHHASRVLTPWQIKTEDQVRPAAAPGEVEPITFALSRGDSKVLRNSTFDLEATLSRRSDDPVVVRFRRLGQENAPWSEVAMSPIERVNGFRIDLPNVNEAMEFHVASGSYESAVHKVGIYHPLVVGGLELVCQYPDYLKLPPGRQITSTGDASVPIGSKVTVRVMANQPIESGRLLVGPSRQPALMKVADDRKSASATLDASADIDYSFVIADENGQVAKSASAATLRTMPDNPPSMDVKFPTGNIETHPLGEINVHVEAGDDLAMDKVELVFERPLLGASITPDSPAGATPPPARLVMDLARKARPADAAPFPDIADATYRLALEDLQPQVMPEEVITYYIQCTDRKGQVFISDVRHIVVTHYETWATIGTNPPHEPPGNIVLSIEDFLHKTWRIHQQKAALGQTEFTQQCSQLAALMVDPETGKLYPFYEAKKIPLAKKPRAARADTFIVSGHKALAAANTEKAIADFKIAHAELTAIGVNPQSLMPLIMMISEGGNPLNAEKTMKQLIETIDVPSMDPKIAPPRKTDLEEIKKIEDIQKAAAKLEEKQRDIVEKAEAIADAGEKATTDKDKEKAKDDAAKLGEKQDDLADKTKAEADRNKPDDAADPKVKQLTTRVDDAARAMKDAAKNLKENKTDDAVADAKRAQDELNKVKGQIEAVRIEKIAAAIAKAETDAAKLLNDQKNVRQQTQDANAKQKDNANPAQMQKEYKKLAIQQAKLDEQMAKLKKDVDELTKIANKDAKADVSKPIEDARKEIVRSGVEQAIKNAVVDLVEHKGESARTQQVKAEGSLEKVVADLRKAGDATAADIQAELRRALAEAKKIEKDLAKLGAKPPATQTADTPAPPSATQPIAKVEPPKPATQPGDEDTKPVSDKDKKDIAEALPYELQRLADHVANRDFADKKDTKILADEAKTGQQLSDKLQKDPDKLNELAGVVRQVRTHLEAEFHAQLEAQRLMAAQREDCPPAYRHLVNKYFEALGAPRGEQVNLAPGSGK